MTTIAAKAYASMRAVLICLSILALAAFAAVSATAQVVEPGDWRQPRFGARQTSFNPSETILNVDNATRITLLKQWSLGERHSGYAYPIVADGMLYLGGLHGVTAFDLASGAIVWTQYSDQFNFSDWRPTYSDGKLFLGVHEYIDDEQNPYRFLMHAYDAKDGRLLWRTPVAGSLERHDILALGSSIVFGDDSGGIYCLDANTGVILWRNTTSSVTPVYRAAAARGAVYRAAAARGLVFLRLGHELRAVEAATGKDVWRVDTIDEGSSGPIVASGRVVVGTGLGVKIYDADTGALKKTLNKVVGALATAGKTLVVAARGMVSAYDLATGEALWRSGGGRYARTPAIANGVVYVTYGVPSQQCRFYAYRLDGGSEVGPYLFRKRPRVDNCGPPVVSRGVVYIASWDAVQAYGLAEQPASVDRRVIGSR